MTITSTTASEPNDLPAMDQVVNCAACLAATCAVLLPILEREQPMPPMEDICAWLQASARGEQPDSDQGTLFRTTFEDTHARLTQGIQSMTEEQRFIYRAVILYGIAKSYLTFTKILPSSYGDLRAFVVATWGFDPMTGSCLTQAVGEA